MQRIPRHRLLAAVLTFLSLMAVAMLPIGGFVSAASAATNCPAGEGPPNCILAISAPESVATGRVFTVQVAVTTDGFTVAKGDPCAKVDVNLLVTDGDGSATYVKKTSGGIATFDIVVTSSGSHTLTATATKPGCSYVPDYANFMAVFVASDQPIAPCPDNVSCAQTTSGSGSAATLFANTGIFSDVAFIALVDQGCGDGGPADPKGVLTFNYTGVDSKKIILALRPDRVTKGIGRYNICWRSSNPFTQRGGTPAPSVGGLFTGYLPNCKKDDEEEEDDTGPCVLFRKSGEHHSAFFGIRAPPGDPQAYPGS